MTVLPSLALVGPHVYRTRHTPAFRVRAKATQPTDMDSSSQGLNAPAALYSPLEETKDEIRLLTILPESLGSPVVHCKLETLSLSSLSTKYQDYTVLHAPDPSKRRYLAGWRKFCATSDKASDVSQDTITSHIPPPECYRYSWGDYAALSYTWGNRRKRRRIVINDQDIYVTLNLEAALCGFASQGNFSNHFKLWVDALCINQLDYIERNKQVSRMSSIYGNSWTVIAWLGPWKDNSDKAINLIEDMAAFNKDGQGQLLEKALENNPDFLGSGSWTALQKLMNREYFYRVWIIQEIVLGATSTVICCGDSTIGWPTFCSGIGVLQNHLWLIKDDLARREAIVQGRGLDDWRWSTGSLHLVHQDLWPMSQYEEQGEGRLEFGRLLDLTNTAGCHDLRDKCYGLVGMMSPSIAQQLVPDYRFPPHEVFSRAAAAFIRANNNLEPLREGNPWSSTETPSWAADWAWKGRIRYSRPDTPTWGQFWNRSSSDNHLGYYKTYHSSGKSNAEFSFSADGQQLTAKGFILDHIVGLGASAKGYFDWRKDSVVSPPKKWKCIYDGREDGVAKALYTTLTQDRINGKNATPRHEAMLSLPSTFRVAGPRFKQLGWKFLAAQGGYYFRWELWRRANHDFLLGGRKLNDYFSDSIPYNAKEADYMESYCAFDRTGKRRRLMATKRGYIGWAPDNMYGESKDQTRVTDLVVILFGCTTPLIIRPYGKQFLVVGEAYVQGVMDGEAMSLLESGECQAHEFTFC